MLAQPVMAVVFVPNETIS